MKFNPKIVTSYRAHGKWGDFIICVLPISWCINILSNSNFILRMLEWQTESNLFTVRVRGKQWYWVYKLEIKNLVLTNQTNKNIGHNYWELFNSGNLNYSNKYINIFQLKNNNEFLQNHFSLIKFLTKFELNSTFNLDIKNLQSNNFLKFYSNVRLNNSNSIFSSLTFTGDTNRHLRTNNFKLFNNLKFNWFNNTILVNENINSQPLKAKHIPDNIYLVIKQKKYLTPKKISTNWYLNQNLTNYKFKNPDSIEIISENLSNNNSFYKMNFFKKRKNLLLRSNINKTIDFNNINYRRLLRTKRILVLPSNVNITVITNSFDVVHSWYIPGLGIKLDCIPGRSTHHSIFIDHAGFYYGQCAEICGRHHHHMPIRICALPFEHFLIWWYHYGLPYYTSFKNRKISINSNLKQYNW